MSGNAKTNIGENNRENTIENTRQDTRENTRETQDRTPEKTLERTQDRTPEKILERTRRDRTPEKTLERTPARRKTVTECGLCLSGWIGVEWCNRKANISVQGKTKFQSAKCFEVSWSSRRSEE